MTHSWRWTLIVVLMVSGVGVGLAVGPLDAQQSNVLVAKKVAAPPPFEPALGGAWQSAPELTVTVRGGRNLPEGRTDVRLRALYTADTIYILMQYKDPDRERPARTLAEAGRRVLAEAQGSERQGRRQQPLLRRQDGDPLEHQLAGLRGQGLHVGLPHRRGQALRQQVHRERRRAPGHVALEGRAHRAVRARSTTSTSTAPGTTRRKPRRPGRKSDPKTGGGYVDNVSDDKKGPKFALQGQPASAAVLDHGRRQGAAGRVEVQGRRRGARHHRSARSRAIGATSRPSTPGRTACGPS